MAPRDKDDLHNSGKGNWNAGAAEAREKARSAAGYKTGLTHTEDINKGKKPAEIAERLDPHSSNRKGEHAGKNIRECMDSTEHPNALPIMVFFDQTGSMDQIPYVLQKKLPELHGLLQRKGYVEDPQICFGAIGDAYAGSMDPAPLQVGQFESDNTMDDDLAAIWIQSGGGGGNHESYELAIYFAARHTHIDIEKKRNGKGYLFIIGDERVYPTVNAAQVRSLIGGVSAELAENISTRDIVKEAQKKYNVFFVYAQQGSYSSELVIDAPETSDAIGWKELLGENAVILEDADAVCEFIGLTLGVMEGTVTLEDGMKDLVDVGASSSAIAAAGKALATVGAGVSPVATSSGDLDLGGGNGGPERL